MFVMGRKFIHLYKRLKCFKSFNECFIDNLYIKVKKKRWSALKILNACMHVCMRTHSQPLLQNRLMDVCETW